jgi:hypothetical protein
MSGMPPVRPLRNLEPWSAPQTLLRNSAPVPDRLAYQASLGGPLPTSGFLPVQSWIAEAHRYATLNTSNFAIPVAGQLVLAEPPMFRNFLALRNTDSTDTIYINFGVSAGAQSLISLAPGQFLVFDTVVPQNDIFAASSANTPNLSIGYSTIAL